MKHTIPFIILICLTAFTTRAQSTVDSVLANISRNNKTILANTQYWEAKKIEYKTGINLYNPSVNYDFMVGSPATAGNQTDITVTQAFDFPTAYFIKRDISELQTSDVEFKLNAERQEILLEAKLLCTELVYRNKLQIQLSKRQSNTEILLNNFQTKLDKGDGNMLDVNKAHFQLIEIKNESKENLSLINQLKQKLAELNGGISLIFNDTVYFQEPTDQDFNVLVNEITLADPIQKSYLQQMQVKQKQIELAKALGLPKMEAGYHYQGILGQTFQGFHVGLTIPLWENKNKVKMEEANLTLNEYLLQDYQNAYSYNITRLYERIKILQSTLLEYEMLFKNSDNITLLNKALNAGQISTIEYFLEMDFHLDAIKKYLYAEFQYYETLSILYKYQL